MPYWLSTGSPSIVRVALALVVGGLVPGLVAGVEPEVAGGGAVVVVVLRCGAAATAPDRSLGSATATLAGDAGRRLERRERATVRGV